MEPQIRNKYHRRKPGNNQRERGHLKNRARVFAGAGAGRGNRQKACHRHQRAGQHRDRRRGIGKTRRLGAIPALFHFDRHHFDRNDRVVHQQSQAKYQGAQRNFVKTDIEQIHEKKCQCHHQRDRQRDHQAGTHAQTEKRHGKHNDDGFRQRAHKLAHAVAYRTRLVVDAVQLETDRQCFLELVERCVEVVAQLHDVAALAHRNSQPQRLLPEVAHFGERRIGEPAYNMRDIADLEDAAVGADGEIFDRIDTIERAGCAHKNLVGRGLERAARRDGVLRLHRGDDGGAVNAQRGEFDVGKFNEYFFFLLADDIDLGHIGKAQHFTSHAVSEQLLVSVTVTLASDGENIAEGIAEFIIEGRADDALWQ